MVTFNLDRLKSLTPSVFADKPSEAVSDKYKFIPTTKILEILHEAGWEPWKALQVQSRTVERKQTARHILRLRHKDQVLDEDHRRGDLFPEILLINSHDGLSAYQLRAGIFRMVCGNGIVVSQEDFGIIRIQHRGFNPTEVYEASEVFCENTARLNNTVNLWRSQELNRDQTRRFAMDAARTRFISPSSDIIDNILNTRREADDGDNLWNVFNRCQENIIQGGFVNEATNRKVRPIKAICTDLKINSELWDVANKYSGEIASA